MTIPWFVYIAKCNDGSYYIGISPDVSNRIKKHNSGIGSRSLLKKLPVSLLYTEEYPNKSEARKREIQLKGWSRKKKQWLIDKYLIDQIADLTHKKFQNIYYQKNNGSRIKTTTDPLWIKLHDTNQADIAKIDYANLPADIKNSRYQGAKVAYQVVKNAIDKHLSFDNAFIENSSHLVHQEWLDRCALTANPEHNLSYQNLSEEDKDKDRVFVYAAIKILKP